MHSYVLKYRILSNLNRKEGVLFSILKAIDLGDERHSNFRSASNIYRDLGDNDNSIKYAKQAVNAKENG